MNEREGQTDGTEYDYIIVGSGAGGSTLAYRLAQSGRNRVLVLEYGPEDDDPLHRIPKGYVQTLQGDRYVYPYPAEPVAGADTRETWLRGKVVGGGTTINTMVYNRGAEADFEAVAAHTGSDRWGWSNFLAAYRAMEDHDLGASPSRGAGGRLGVSATGADDELASLLFEAGGKLGWKHVEDVNDSDDERIGYSASTIRHGLRTSAASAFLRPALEAGVALETGVRAERILISGGRAVGVAGRRGATAVTFHVRKEVFVACGAVESPLLLERSGIGRPDLLHRLGIELQVSSPNVGERVIEHRVVAVQVRFRRKLGAAEDFCRLLQNGDLGASFEPATDGVLSAAGLDFVFHAKSEPGLARPDLSAVAAPYPIDPTAAGYRPANHSGMTIGMFQSRPETTSTIHSSAPGPDAPPTITARYLETETDQRAAGRILGRLRELLGANPLAEVIEGEDYPTEAVASDPESGLAYARNYGAPGYHAVGSCAMGPTADDVLDAELRVRGVDGLRVVDASAFPFQVSANIGAPVMALAWLAADLVE